MGLFTNKKNPCVLCGAPTPRLFATEVEGRPICGNCKDKINLPDGVFPEMSLEDVRQYMAFFDENVSLQQIYHETFCHVCGGWNDQISVDREHRLFRIRRTFNAMALEGSCLKGFRILENDSALFESCPEGLKCCASDIPDKARALAPLVAQFQMEHQHYEYMKEMQDMLKEQRADRQSATTSYQYLSEPYFRHQLIDKVEIELTLEHPYWGGVRVLENPNNPIFSDTRPDVDNFLSNYEKHVERLHALASELAFLMNPEAVEIQVPSAEATEAAGAAENADARAVPAADPVAEIQRYKALLDSGLLTEEEFTAKKRQLLGI